MTARTGQVRLLALVQLCDGSVDHDHSAYVDQCDWEKAISAQKRNLDFRKQTVRGIEKALQGAEAYVQEIFPALRDLRYPNLPEEIMFIQAEDLLARYPDLPRKQRETELLQECAAVLIIGIGWTLGDGYPHEMRAADYDDWVTETNRRRRISAVGSTRPCGPRDRTAVRRAVAPQRGVDSVVYPRTAARSGDDGLCGADRSQRNAGRVGLTNQPPCRTASFSLT